MGCCTECCCCKLHQGVKFWNMLLIIGGVLGVVDIFTDIQIDDAAYLKHCSTNGTLTVQWNGTD
jgi:hypothetical protein